MLKAYSTFIYVFLYAPIALIILFSFNAGRHAASFECCSVMWFGKALGNRFVVEALTNSLIIGLSAATIATLFGTLAVLGLQRVKGVPRMIYDALTYAALIVPGIVIGIATLTALVTIFNFANPILADFWPAILGKAPRLKMGYATVIAAHSLFTMAIVIVIVRTRLEAMDQKIIEASSDLGANPKETFFRVTLPQIAPAILSGFLLSFTFSFDDFIVAFFVSGSQTTLPMYIFSSIRRGITPEINAISTIIILFTVSLMVTAKILEKK